MLLPDLVENTLKTNGVFPCILFKHFFPLRCSPKSIDIFQKSSKTVLFFNQVITNLTRELMIQDLMMWGEIYGKHFK